MTDTHTHILPAMDDGAASAEDSINLLKSLALQGVKQVAATPHFKPITSESIDSFLARRDKSEALLRQAMQGQADLPNLYVGTEVTLSVELAQFDGLEKLCYQNGKFLLIELDPFTIGSWIPRALYEISNRLLLTPVLAHVDRYLSDVPQKLIDEIMQLNCPVQFNGYALANFRKRRQLIKLMDRHLDTIFVVGSDCHNMHLRPPTMDIFEKKAMQHLGEDFFEEICENSRLMLTGDLIT